MNYQKLHDAIINDAQTNSPQGYAEKHHIQPRCLGGNNTKANLVSLSARQHFIVHWLLTKLYPNHSGIRYAFHMMFHPTSRMTRVTDWVTTRSIIYAHHKEAMGIVTGDRMRGIPKTEEQKQRMREAANRRWRNPTERAAQSTRMLGNTNGLGITRGALTESHKLSISRAAKERYAKFGSPLAGKPKSPESITKMKETKRRNPHKHTSEQSAAQSVRQFGRIQPVAQKQKVAAKLSKTWRIVTPAGQTEIITNLRQYCIANKLSQGNLSNHGHSKGYTATVVPK